MKRTILLFLMIFCLLPSAQLSAAVKQDSSVNASQQVSIEDAYDSVASATAADSSAMMARKKIIPVLKEYKFNLKTLLRGVFGMLVLIFIAFIFSTNKRAINWRVVITGLVIQVLLAIGVLQVGFIQLFFEYIGKIFVVILDFTKEGTEFLFSGFLDTDKFGYIFAFQVLPTIIFFSALTSVLFYFGIIQKVVYALAWVMTKVMRLTGAESLSVAGNIFLGQTESPLMIKAYLSKMTRSEILLVMTGGMATLAGGVLAAYIGFLGGADPHSDCFLPSTLSQLLLWQPPGLW